MKTISRLGLAACAGLALPALAFAGTLDAPVADAGVASPAPRPASDLSGFWLGGSVGMGSVSFDLVGEGALSNGEDDLGFDFDLPDAGGAGPFAAIEVGHDWGLGGGWHLAVQMDYEVGRIVNDTSFSVASLDSDESASFDYQLNRESALTGLVRLGRTLSDRVMVYGLAGMTRARFVGSYSLDAADIGGPDWSDSYSFDVSGLTLGAGIEAGLGADSSIKFEYRRTGYADYELIDIGEDDQFFRSAIEAEAQSFRITWVQRF